jgi:hypothetical protein
VLEIWWANGSGRTSRLRGLFVVVVLLLVLLVALAVLGGEISARWGAEVLILTTGSARIIPWRQSWRRSR